MGKGRKTSPLVDPEMRLDCYNFNFFVKVMVAVLLHQE